MSNVKEKLNKFYDKTNLVFAYFFVFFIVFVSLINANTISLVITFGVMYFIFLLLKLPMLFFIENKKQFFLKLLKKPLVWLAVILLLLIILNAFIYSINADTIYYLSFFALFVCIYSVKNSNLKCLINTLLIIAAISCIMGFIDPRGEFMPGFSTENFPFSTHFFNPNYSGYIIGTLLILTIFLFYYAKTKKENIFYGVIFAIYSYFMFLNGSFGPIIAVFIAVFASIIYIWVKDKKFPLKMVIIYLSIIPFIFLSDLYPNIQNLRTCKYNFFLECVAVFDNIFNTNLLDIFNIDFIKGSDGWDRAELLRDSWNSIKDAPIGLILGHGAGYFYNTCPNNKFLAIWLDFGLIALCVYVAILVILFVIFFKRKRDKLEIAFPMATLGFIIMGFFGSLFTVSYAYFIFVFALSFKFLLQKNDNPKVLETQKAI